MDTINTELIVAKISEKGLSNREVAEYVGSGEANLHSWLYKGVQPRIRVVKALCTLLGITPNQVIGCDKKLTYESVSDMIRYHLIDNDEYIEEDSMKKINCVVNGIVDAINEVL